MHWQHTPYTLPLIISAAISAALALFAWRRRPVSGATPVALLMLAVAQWQLGYALELASADLPSQLLWAKVEYLGMVMVPVAWLAFVFQYTGRERWLARRNLALLAIEPLVTLLLVWTNDLHGLIYSNIRLDTSGSFSVLSLAFGAWSWVDVAYSYLLLVFSVLLLIRALIPSSSLYREQVGVLLMGVFTPWAAEVLSLSGLSPFSPLDLTPFAFTVTGLAMVWGMFRFRLLDVMPVARDTVIKGMSDGMIVLDTQNRIVDLNPAAQRIIGSPAEEAIGQAAVHVLSAWPDLVRFYGGVTEAQEEVVLGEGEAQRTYDLRVSPLYDRRGRLLILCDITKRKQAEEEIKQRSRELAALNAIAAVVSQSLNLDEILNAALDKTLELMHLNVGGIYLADPVRRKLDLVAHQGVSKEFVREIDSVSVDEKTLEAVMAEGKLRRYILSAEAVIKDRGELNRIVSAMKKEGLSLASGAPVLLQAKEDILGLMIVASRVPRRYSEAELQLLTSIGQQIATAIENARLYQANQRELAERKRAEEEAKAKSQFLESLIEQSPLPTFVIDSAGICVMVNKAFLKAYNVPQKELVVGQNALTQPANVRQGVVQYMQEALSGKTVETPEIESISPYENKRTVTRSRLFPIFDATNGVTNVVVMHEDITERKKAEAELIRLATALDASVDGILIVDIDGNIVEINEAVLKKHGFHHKRDMIGKNALEFIAPEDREKAFAAMREVTEEGYIAGVEYHIITRSSSKIPVEANGVVMKDEDGKPIGFVTVVRDITERKRAEEVLRRRAEEMAALVEMNRAITADIDLKETLDRILSNAQKMIPVSDCSVTLVDESSGDLVVEASTDGEIGLRISPAAPSAVGWVVKTKQILAEEDVSSNPIFSQQLVKRYGFKSGLAVPIIYKNKAIGTLSFGNRHVRRAFSDSEKMMAQAFAYQAAIAIQNARLFEAERDQRELAQALEEAAATVSSTLDLDEVLDRILVQTERVVAGDAFSVILIEDDVAHLVRWRGCELPGEEILSSRFDIPMARYSTLMKMAQMGKPFIVPDTSLDPDWVPAVRDQAGWRQSYVGVPIRLGTVTVGFLGVSGTRPGQFVLEDARRLEAFASHAATAIGNARLYEEIQRKAEELKLLLDTATAVSSTIEPDRILRTLAEKMTTSVGATFCRIALLDEMNQTLTVRAAFAAHDLDWDPGLGRQVALADVPWHRQAIEKGQIMILRQDDPSQAVSEMECRMALSEGIQSALLIPLVIGDRTLGVISLGEMRTWERLPFTADRVRLCQAMANQTAVTVRTAQLLDAGMKHRRDLQRLSTQLVNAQEAERRRISRELHDEIGQALTMLNINLTKIEEELPPEIAATIRERLAETSSLADQLLEKARELSLDLRPRMLDDLGVVSALRWYLNKYTRSLDIEVEMEAIDFEERLSAEMETALYRVVQEALTNVARHAQANRVCVRLERKESTVRALIEDDGQGFDVEKITGRQASARGVGLLGVQERVTSLGGNFNVQSGPGEGTRLTIEIPV
jgi:PAS domain S-box-containing protein